MRRIRLDLSYDGSGFCGWQIQARGRTVQGVVEEALSDLLKETVRVIGAGRTDSGVHAERQSCHFDTQNESLPADKFAQICPRLKPLSAARYPDPGKQRRRQPLSCAVFGGREGLPLPFLSGISGAADVESLRSCAEASAFNGTAEPFGGGFCRYARFYCVLFGLGSEPLKNQNHQPRFFLRTAAVSRFRNCRKRVFVEHGSLHRRNHFKRIRQRRR